MPLTLVPTVGASDANAFVDVAYVTAHAESNGDAGLAWLALDDDQQVGTIIAATRTVNARRYCGDQATPTQRLKFPRTGLDYFADNVIPSPVEEATAIEAIARAPLFKAGATAALFPMPATAAPQLIEKETGPLKKKWAKLTEVAATSVQSLTADAQLLLADLLCGDDASAYGISSQNPNAA